MTDAPTAQEFLAVAGFSNLPDHPDAKLAKEVCDKLVARLEAHGATASTVRHMRKQALRSLLAAQMSEPKARAAVSAAFGSDSKPVEDLLEIVDTTDELWHDEYGRAFATTRIGGNLEHMQVDSDEYEGLLMLRYYRSEAKAASAAAIKNVKRTVEARARFDGQEHRTHVRVAEIDDVIYVDLGDKDRNVAEVTAENYRIIQDPPVRFHRPPTLAPLPLPEEGGSIDDLRPFVNLNGEDDFRLYVGAMLSAFRSALPNFIISINGPQGSTKSTLCRLLVDLTDPNEVPLRTLPKNEQDFALSTLQCSVLSYDNLERIPQWFSPALCRASTGGGYAARKLYSNDGLVVINTSATVVLNGISKVLEKPDALNRAIAFQVPRIEMDHYVSQEDLSRRFEKARPQIFGALLRGLSSALENREAVKEQIQLPRMTDAVAFAAAGGIAYGWDPAEFNQAYKKNEDEAVEVVLDGHPLGSVLWEFVDTRGQAWEGTASELLEELQDWVGARVRRQSDWPTNASQLSGALNVLEHPFERIGITFRRRRSKDKSSRKLIHVSRTAEGPTRIRQKPLRRDSAPDSRQTSDLLQKLRNLFGR